MKIFYALLIVVLIAAVGVGIASALYTDCDYYTPVVVTNTSGTAYTGLRVNYKMFPSSLIASGMMTADADDSFLMLGAVQSQHTAMALSSGNVTWTGFLSSVPETSLQTYKMWTGDSAAVARDQYWCADDGDVVTVADAASLDITTNLTVTADAYLDNLPATTKYFVNKPGNYYLGVDGTKYVFGVTQVAGSTHQHLYPDGVGNYTNIASVQPGATAHWSVVDEAAEDDADYVYTTSAVYQYDDYTLSSLSSSIPVTASITSIDVVFRAKGAVVTGIYAKPGIRLNNVEVLGSAQLLTNAYVTYTQTGFARPGGGCWLPSDLGGLEVIIGLVQGGATTTYCSQVNVIVNYTVTTKEVTAVATTDAWKTITGAYTGAAVKIYINGAEGNTTALAGALNTSCYNMSLLAVDGMLDDVKVGDTVVYPGGYTAKMNFDFDAVDIASTGNMTGTIDDNSASSNDAPFTLATMPAGVTVTVGSVEFDSYSSGVGNDTTIVPNVAGNTSEPAGWYPPGSHDLPFSQEVGAAANAMGWTMDTMWSVLLLFIAMVFGVGATIATGSPMLGALACGVIMVVGVSTGAVAMWVVFAYALLAMGYLLAVRSGG
jgi:hypothetical protein